MINSSGTAFYLFFTALYLLESVTLCSGSAVLFWRGFSGAVKYRFARDLPRFWQGRLFMAPLLNPAASFFITGSMPVIFSGKGFCSVLKDGETGAEQFFYSFDRVKRIGVSLNSLTVNGKTFCKMHSEHEAEWWKEHLLRLARTGPGSRESEALGMLDEMFDTGTAVKFITSCAGNTFFLSVMISMLFIYCFLVVPAAAWIFSLAMTWPLLLIIFFLQVTVAVPVFVSSYKKIFPSRRVPWSRVVSMLLYTPSLLRCMDIINKTSLSVCHPAAVARALDNGKVFRRLLSCYYRAYTIAPLPQQEPGFCEVISWYRKHAAERIVKAAGETGISSVDLLAPPVRKDEEIKSYCPFCHEQYVREEGTCSECGIKLECYR